MKILVEYSDEAVTQIEEEADGFGISVESYIEGALEVGTEGIPVVSVTIVPDDY